MHNVLLIDFLSRELLPTFQLPEFLEFSGINLTQSTSTKITTHKKTLHNFFSIAKQYRNCVLRIKFLTGREICVTDILVMDIHMCQSHALFSME